MALPDTRETNYAALQQLKSADLNTWQDWIAALANRTINVDVSKFVNVENFEFTANLYPNTDNAGATALVPLELDEGWTITGASARGSDTGFSAAPTVSIAARAGDAAPAAIAGGVISGFTPFTAVMSVSGLTELIPANTSYCFLIETPPGWTPGNFFVSQLSITIQRASVPAVPA